MEKVKKFTRNKEDFTCGKCGALNIGNGYTNHCSQCLWSKHVDIHPGDRKNTCGGLMEPYRIEGITGKYRVMHKCVICGMQKHNKILETDNIDALLGVIEKRAKDFIRFKDQY